MSHPPPPDFELPIFHNTYQLLLTTHERTSKFPKQDRYTVGERLQVLAMDFFASIIRANAVRGDTRRNVLAEASVTLDLFKIMLRLANDIEALPEKGYLDLANRSRDIGRQLGGWIKST